MRVPRLFVLTLILQFWSCTYNDNATVAVDARPSAQRRVVHARAVAALKPFDFDIVQRTCAMYVAMHSKAFNAPVSFDRTIDDTMVHWNKCTNGNAVACATVSAVTDPVQAGIPWPY